MGFLALLAVAAIGWAVWTGKLQQKQLLPVVLGLAGAFIAAPHFAAFWKKRQAKRTVRPR